MISLWLTYLPLGLLGLARWASWLVRRLPAALYRPAVNDFRLPISVVVPVYQEDPVIFARAIESWLTNQVEEIILVIDVTDRTCIEVASRYPVTVEITDVPGKRDALRRGWERARTPLVALVDSDVIWADDVAAKVAMPFADDRVGGVATRQNVYEVHGFLQRINDMYLDYRYFDENAAQTVMGGAVSCISGRTAVYRRDLLLEISAEFMSETFLGVQCLSGDDKCLTRLILVRGHRAVLQRSARVWSTFPNTLRIFFKQRLRWARNTWRSDLTALWLASTWRRRPFLAFTMADKAVSSFTLLAAPTFMTVGIVRGHWLFVCSLAIWWWVSRAVKMLPHLRRHPSSFFLIPPFVLLSFAMAFVKIGALLTIRRQRWLTRKVSVRNGQVVRDISPEDVEPQLEPAGVASLVEHRSEPLGGAQRPLSSESSRPAARRRRRRRWLWVGAASALLAAASLPLAVNRAAAVTVDSSVSSATRRAIVLRPTRVDLVSRGSVVRTWPHAPGAVSLDQLAAVAGPAWVQRGAQASLELHAPLIQAPGSSLVVGSRAVRSLLVDDGAYLRGSQAKAALGGVSVVGWDPRLGAPSRNVGGRGYVYYSHGSKVTVSKSTFSFLGNTGAGTGALSLTSGSTGSVLDSRFVHSAGLRLDRAGRVTLRAAQVASSDADGIVVRQSAHVTLFDVTANDNHGNGIVLSGPGAAPAMRGRVVVSGNSEAGLLARNLHRLSLSGVQTMHNGGAGVLLDGSPGAVSGLRSHDEQIGLSISAHTRGVRVSGAWVTNAATGLDLQGSDVTVAAGEISASKTAVRVGPFGTRVTLAGVLIRGSAVGVQVDDRARSVVVRASTIEQSQDAGVRVNGSRVQLKSVTVRGAPTGIDLRGGARTISVTGSTIEDTVVAGIAATGSVSDVTLTDVAVRAQSGTGIASGTRNLVVEGGTVQGATLGLDLRGTSHIRALAVTASQDGAHVASDAWASLNRVDLAGARDGLWAGQRARVWLQASKIEAKIPVRGPVQLVGNNDIPPLPIPWLGLVGVFVVLAASAFEIIRRMRETSMDRQVLAPIHVTNPF